MASSKSRKAAPKRVKASPAIEVAANLDPDQEHPRVKSGEYHYHHGQGGGAGL